MLHLVNLFDRTKQAIQVFNCDKIQHTIVHKYFGLNIAALEKNRTEKIKKVSKQNRCQFIENRVSYLPTKRRATIDIFLLEVNIIVTT